MIMVGWAVSKIMYFCDTKSLLVLNNQCLVTTSVFHHVTILFYTPSVNKHLLPPSLSDIVGIQGKPVSIATITLFTTF